MKIKEKLTGNVFESGINNFWIRDLIFGENLFKVSKTRDEMIEWFWEVTELTELKTWELQPL